MDEATERVRAAALAFADMRAAIRAGQGDGDATAAFLRASAALQSPAEVRAYRALSRILDRSRRAAESREEAACPAP